MVLVDVVDREEEEEEKKKTRSTAVKLAYGEISPINCIIICMPS